MDFPEEIIHYVWKTRVFSNLKIESVHGKPIEIISPGMHNHHSGPDFEEAKIKIGETLWAGSVEMHIKSSDWFRHHHQTDKAYQNVILHVVYEHDKDIFLADGTLLETFVIKDFISKDFIQKYNDLVSNLNWIPCEKLIHNVDELHQKTWLSRVSIERLEAKHQQIIALLEENKGSWDDAFYVILARNFGFKINALPFEFLAKSLSQQLLGKHKNSALQIEALIFGQAGFLDDKFNDAYPLMLQAEYEFLMKKYHLIKGDRFAWKFMRMRPANFPTIRLAQFCALVKKSNHLFSVILEKETVGEIIDLFKMLPINTYWANHYRFDVEVKTSTKQIGSTTLNTILINTIVPFLFSYGKYFNNERLMKRAQLILENLPPENNSIINTFKELGVVANSAETTQALLQLKNNYCNKKKCIDCGIGNKLMSR